MRNFGNGFDKLLEYARENALGFILNYSESEDNFTIEIYSPAKIEEYAEKRVYNIEDFIENHKDHVKKGLELQKNQEVEEYEEIRFYIIKNQED